MANITVTQIGSEEVIVNVAEENEIIIQTISDGPTLGNYITDHSQCTNLDSDDHPQYLNNTRGDLRYTDKAHSSDTTIHYSQSDIYINQNQINGIGSDTILTSADIGVSIQPYNAILANTTASYTTEESTKLSGLPTASQIALQSDIGVSIQAHSNVLDNTTEAFTTELKALYDANIGLDTLTDSDIGVTVQAYNNILNGTEESFTTLLKTKLDSLPTDSLVAADIGTNVQAYSLVLTNTTASFTTALKTKLDALPTNPVITTDIGSTVQAHSLVLDSTTASFTTALETKLNGIEALAEVNNIIDANADLLTQGNNTNLHYHTADRARSVHTGTQSLDTVVNDNLINNPINNIGLNVFISELMSSGITELPTLTHAGSGVISITGVEFFIRDNVNGTGDIISSYIAGDNAAVTLTDNATNYIYIDYNAGNPSWEVTTDPTIINLSDKIPVGIATMENTVVYMINVSADNRDANAKLRKKLFYTEGFTKASGGTISNTGLTLNVTSGNYWFGLSEYVHNALTNFRYYYYNGSTWTVNSTATAISGTQYNDTSSGLVNLTNKYYCNHWIYAVFDGTNSTYAVVYGQNEYVSLTEAFSETPPTTVPVIIGNACLIGSVIVYEDTNSIVKIKYVGSVEEGSSISGASGSFTSNDGKTITVVNGIITDIA